MKTIQQIEAALAQQAECELRDAELANLKEQVKALREALQWALDNLGAGIDWHGPYDDQHPQGVYECKHCKSTWLPNGEGKEYHNAGCGLENMVVTLADAGESRKEGSGK